MDIEALLSVATDDERVVLARLVERKNATPAVVVTVQSPRGKHYVVAQQDEDLFADLVGLAPNELREAVKYDRAGFEAQWLRGPGRVDEMSRTLALADVRTVRAVPRERVWGPIPTAP